MSFLTINGMAISVADEQAASVPREFGLSDYSYSPALRSTRRAIRREYTLSTTRLAEATAEMVERLLLGEGWHFSMNTSLYSDIKQVAPSAGYGASIVTGTPTPKLGAGCCKMTSGGTLAYPLVVTGDYTVMWWFYNTSTWEHLACVYDVDANTCTRYVNGAVNTDTWYNTINASNRWGASAAGTVTMYGKLRAANTNSATSIDDMVVLPYKATTDLINAHYNAGSGRAFSDLPRLNMSGSIIKSSTVDLQVLGAVDEVRSHQGVTSGSWSDKMRSIKFRLRAVSA